jgi:hypothetical protein
MTAHDRVAVNTVNGAVRSPGKKRTEGTVTPEARLSADDRDDTRPEAGDEVRGGGADGADLRCGIEGRADLEVEVSLYPN